MIAGEYAVLEPNQKAVVAAVNRYVTAHIKNGKENQLSLPQLYMENITWEMRGKSTIFNVINARLSFIENAISTAIQFLQEKSVVISPVKLRIESQLDDPYSGKKYGLGSSAAVVVAVISSLLSLYSYGRELPSPEIIFKLSAIAHLKTQGSGSGADIAAAVYGGWLEYSAFDVKWVLEETDRDNRLVPLLEKTWPNLLIKRLTPPQQLQLAVGWTKESASTASMIKNVQSFSKSHIDTYNEFLRESSISVNHLIQSFERKDNLLAINSLMENRKALKKLSDNAHIVIETEELKTLCDIAEYFGSGKSSGAGGGDCGIAFIMCAVEKQELHKAWTDVGICPLDLGISDKGVFTEKMDN